MSVCVWAVCTSSACERKSVQLLVSSVVLFFVVLNEQRKCARNAINVLRLIKQNFDNRGTLTVQLKDNSRRGHFFFIVVAWSFRNRSKKARGSDGPFQINSVVHSYRSSLLN